MAIGVNARSSLSGAAGDAKGRLFDAALHAFATQGFQGTTTRDISSAAQMSPAALYVHYRSKEELLHVISLSGHRDVLALCRAAVAAHSDPLRQLERLAVDFARFHALNHTMARIVNFELASLTPEHRAEVMALRSAMDALVRDVLRRGCEAGVFQVEHHAMTAGSLLSLGIDISRWYDENRGWTPDQVAEHHRVLALRMVGAAG